MTSTLAPEAATGQEPPSAGETARRRWRSWRAVVLALLALVVVAVIVIAIRPQEQTSYLDPDNAGPQGTRALVAITRAHGTPVTVVRSVAAAAADMRANPNQTLVVTRSDRLVAADLRILAALPGDRLLIEPDGAALTALAHQVDPIGAENGGTPEPECAYPGARAAGDIDLPGGAETYAAAGATSCYGAALVQVTGGSSTVSLLGSGRPLTNQFLADDGDAALGMNLLGARPSVVWLMPSLPKPGSGGRQSFFQLVPLSAELVTLQLFIAVVAAALWRMRRFGPAVREPLPVVVRAAEAVEGRARLYRARQATDRAAASLRSASVERLTHLLGFTVGGTAPAGSPDAQAPAGAHEVVAAVAARTGLPVEQVGAALFGPPPASDAELVRLANFLDALERKVRTS